MKRLRIAAIAAAALLALLSLVVAAGFSSWFQTWAARRALTSTPGWSGRIGSVTAGLQRIEIKDVRLEHDGAVLVLPSAEADLPLFSAAFRDRLLVSRLVAKGWMLDLTKWRPAVISPGAHPAERAASTSSSGPPAPRSAGERNAAKAPSEKGAGALAAFHGIFQQLRLPVELVLDGVDVAGEVVLPDKRGRAKVAFTGGGLAAGREGRFAFRGDAALADPEVSAVGAAGTLTVVMDTPRTLTRMGLKADAEASGTQFPNGLKLAGEVSAARTPAGENYSAKVMAEDRQLLLLQADFPRQAPRLAGIWKLDVRDTDLTPFALGRRLPRFEAGGEGNFETDAAFTAGRATGRFSGSLDELKAVLPALAGVGAVKVSAEFDVARRNDAFEIRQLNAEVANDAPVATLRMLQAFEYDPKSAKLKATDPAGESVGVVLHGVPLAWIQPFLADLSVSGGHLRGELVASLRAGGASVRTTSPLTVAGASVAGWGRVLLEAVDLALSTSADYTPRGWQAEIGELTAISKGVTLLSLSGKAGQLAGDGQPLKATGQMKADLPGAFGQPAARGALVLVGGDAQLDFIASFGPKKELQAKIVVANLAAPAPVPGAKAPLDAPPGVGEASTGAKLPKISVDLRADINAGGDLTINAPIIIERDARKSDLTIAGTLSRPQRIRTIDAHVTSTHLVIEDAQVLAALLPPAPEEVPGAGQPPATRPATPAWHGLQGTLALQLDQVIYAGTFQASNVVGTLRLEENGISLEGVRVMLGEGDAKLTGTVSFNRSAPQPYELAAEVAMTQFDPAPLFRAVDPTKLPAVEGKFNVQSQVFGRAESLEALVGSAGGSFELTSRGGVFRGLAVNAGQIVESTSRLTAWIASAGTALGTLTGRKEYADVANKAEAVSELAKGLNPISYDQLAMVVRRDGQLNTTLEEFAMISPELRLSGRGYTAHQPGARLLDDTLALDFTLRARGRQGELLKYLGALDGQPDELGYSACTVPVKVRGTLGNPDASEFGNRVAALALERSGLADRATEFLNRIRGNGGK